ncbi:cyclic peptide export ABC transporter [Polyangium sp. 6x1]|uniref:cyclic peptide export ABC transporter n=1 Tax=Polyangium sp. 6x1 TaxID=3042689 RepID=UPI002482D953|nr:cyclic peptide export ABC transporter [Polyangium sp. 6x1]MDI1443043.1 cyclic peptide export ABC transporter [Polyangium sp. 6x1]
MRLVKLLLRQSFGLVVLSVLCGLLSGAAFAALVALLNEALASDEGRLGDLGSKFVAVAAVALVTRVASQVLLTWVRHRALLEMRHQLASRILAAPLRSLEEQGPHLVLGALMEGVVTAGTGLSILPFFFTNVIVILASLSYLAWLSLGALGVMLACIVVGLVTYWIPTIHAMRLLEQGRNVQDTVFKQFQSLVSGIKELKLHRRRRGAFLDEHLVPTIDKMQRLGVKSQNFFTGSSAWGLLFFFVFLGVLVFVYQRWIPLDRATLTGYALATLYIQQPLGALMDMIPVIGQGEVAVQKIEKLGLSLSAERDLAPRAEPPEAPRTFEVIELSKVTHTYHRENEEGGFTLGPIDLTLRRGELVFVVGGNGSGKTTLAKLITGLYTPEGGEIQLDGRSVSDADREDYRELFSAIFSDYHVFDVLLGLSPAQRETRVKHYLARLLLDKKVAVVGGALSTTALSQGQRKRLALLATYLEDRPIYLFDEWAADQDPQFKDVFYRELLPELRSQGKTVVAITHDDRYFDLADRVVKLEDGRLAADATLRAGSTPKAAADTPALAPADPA